MLRYLASFAVAAGALAAATSAQAQVAFDWGGDTFSDSGKQTVKFNHPARPGDIIVSFSDRKLYFVTAPGIADTYPIAIPREQSRWEGVTSVSQKREHPAWTPTPTMLAENPRLPRWVPGGHPMNPLGNRALYLGSSAYRIHGTDAPWTIGTAASKGCVRLFNKDVADLYPRVKMGAKVTVTWKSFGGGKGNEIATKPTSTGGNDTASKSKSASGPQSYASANSAATSLFSDDDQPQATANDAASEPVARKSAKQRVDRKPKAPAAAAAKEEATAVSAPVQPPAAENGAENGTENGIGDAVAQTAVAPTKPARNAARKGTDDKSASKSRKTSPIETGSVASEASPRLAAISTTDPAEIAARAEAAANRAADAAERAAAAAERVLQQRSAKTAVE
ncbi:MAG: L,D-transpeptidase [Hyphomicrobium aestuarii]|nr:L,D-transpeptidase [Hyphomicrobium aestuarii]